MKIYTVGNPILRKKAPKIKKVDKKIKKYVDEMFHTMENNKPQGIGLAATQVGINLSFFVFKIDEEKGVVLNPEILETKGDSVYEEGCLSVPGVYANIHRPETILIRYYDLSQKMHEEEVGGLKARVFQHEIDHLNGILFTDYIERLEDVFVEEGFMLPDELVKKLQEK